MLAMWRSGSVPSVYEILYRPAAEDALDKLEADPAMAGVLQAVERVLARLEEDPFSPRLGTTAFMTDEYRGVNATPAGPDDWYIFWQRAQEPRTIEVILVHQLRRSR